MASEDEKLVAALRRDAASAGTGAGALAHDLIGIATGPLLARAETARKARLGMAAAMAAYADALADLIIQFRLCAR